MNLPTTAFRSYRPLPMAIHWLSALLVLATYVLIELHEAFPKGSDLRSLMKNWHFMAGLSLLALTALRLPVRMLNPPPGITPPPAAWQQKLAGLMHLALYAFLLLMPLLGWLALSAKGKPVMLIGLELPALLPPNEDLAHNIKEIHETLGTLGYLLIGGHVLAALQHHFLLCDDTLRRMLPGQGQKNDNGNRHDT